MDVAHRSVCGFFGGLSTFHLISYLIELTIHCYHVIRRSQCIHMKECESVVGVLIISSDVCTLFKRNKLNKRVNKLDPNRTWIYLCSGNALFRGVEHSKRWQKTITTANTIRLLTLRLCSQPNFEYCWAWVITLSSYLLNHVKTAWSHNHFDIIWS